MSQVCRLLLTDHRSKTRYVNRCVTMITMITTQSSRCLTAICQLGWRTRIHYTISCMYFLISHMQHDFRLLTIHSTNVVAAEVQCQIDKTVTSEIDTKLNNPCATHGSNGSTGGQETETTTSGGERTDERTTSAEDKRSATESEDPGWIIHTIYTLDSWFREFGLIHFASVRVSTTTIIYIYIYIYICIIDCHNIYCGNQSQIQVHADENGSRFTVVPCSLRSSI